MSLRSIFRSPRLAGRNLRYVVFYKKKNLVLRKSPLREDHLVQELPKSGTVEQIRTYCAPVGPGSGAGRGGGAGGSIRESGGSLGQYGAANEEEYFYSKQREQLKKLKDKQRKEPKEEGLGQKQDKPSD